MGAKLRNAIGYDIWELKSIGIGLKIEGGGKKIWVASAKGQKGEVELTIMPFYYLLVHTDIYTCSI